LETRLHAQRSEGEPASELESAEIRAVLQPEGPRAVQTLLRKARLRLEGQLRQRETKLRLLQAERGLLQADLRLLQGERGLLKPVDGQAHLVQRVRHLSDSIIQELQFSDIDFRLQGIGSFRAPVGRSFVTPRVQPGLCDPGPAVGAGSVHGHRANVGLGCGDPGKPNLEHPIPQTRLDVLDGDVRRQ